MAVLEVGKAARQIDGALDYVSQMKAERDDMIASYEGRLAYGYIVISELAKTATHDQVGILLDLCRVLHNGKDDDA